MTAPGPSNAAALEQALALAGVGCCLLDTESGNCRTAGQLGQLLGKTNDDLPSHTAGWLTITHPEDRDSFATHLATSPTARRASLTARLRHGNGLL